MTDILVYGALGRMGSLVVNAVERAEDLNLAAAVDEYSQGGAVKCFPVEVTEHVDVVVDFSHHSLTGKLLKFCLERSLPLVLCTTGHTDEERAAVTAAAERIPIFSSANMSLGIAALTDLARRAAALFPDADIEIVEAHHNRKLDAPSGTALMLARAMQEVRPGSTLNIGRSGMGKREKNEIGVQALRMGNLPGTHAVIIATDTQTITLKHEAHDRALFAEGALSAARFIVGKPAGLYDMTALVG